MTQPLPAWRSDDRMLARLAWAVWAVLIVSMSAYMAHQLVRNPGMPLINQVYEAGSRAWWERRSIYAPFTFHGFLYMPSSAVAYSPFLIGPLVLRHVLVRVVFAACLVAGLASVARLAEPRRRGAWFALLTLATLPLVVQNFRQAQMNLPYVGGLLWATAALAQRRFGRAALALSLTLAIKPLTIVLLLLVGAAFPRAMAWRLALGVVLVFLAPFAFGPPDYVWSQWVDFVHKMRVTGAPTTNNYELRGLLATGFGLHVPQPVMTVVRVAAGLGVLVLALAVQRRHALPALALHLYTFAALFLMLFNPKNEDPSYLVLAPAIGYFMLHALLEERRPVTAILLALIPLLLSLSWELWGGRQYWFRPALALAFGAFVVVTLFRRRSTDPGVLIQDRD